MIAHIGALPLEEVLPILTGAGSGLLAVRAWMTRARPSGSSRVAETRHRTHGNCDTLRS